MKNWFAIQTKFRQERNAELVLIARGYITYLPLKLIDRRKQQRKNTTVNHPNITEPLFPTYLFIQMDEGKDDFHPITKTPGVTQIVKMTKGQDGYLYPTVIPNEVIQSLRQLENEQGIHKTKIDYEKGDRVLITQGPFKDFPGEVFSLNDEERIILLVQFFNSLKEIEVDYRSVSPL